MKSSITFLLIKLVH